MKRIYWIAGWYPNLVEPLNGDFVERHAIAASLYNKIRVAFVRKDHLGVTTSKIFRETRHYGLTGSAEIVYYKVPFRNFSWLHKTVSKIRFFALHLACYRKYVRTHGKPDLVHVHVGLEAGLVGLLIKRIYGVPYIITEHWTGFCPEAMPNFEQQPRIKKITWHLVMKQAILATVVSQYLDQAIRRLIPAVKTEVLPNVVDVEVFKPVGKKPARRFAFVHISSLHYQKNPECILEAVRILAAQRNDFSLEIYGPQINELIERTQRSRLSNIIRFHGEVPHPGLALELAQYDALILYSRFETFGCVIIEANACGLPVIVSNLRVMREIVQEGVNGTFAGFDSPAMLAEKMNWMIDHVHEFNALSISASTSEKFSFHVIGAAFNKLYQEITDAR